MKNNAEARVKLLNSIASNIVDYMDKSLPDPDFGICDLSFSSQKSPSSSEIDFLAVSILVLPPQGRICLR